MRYFIATLVAIVICLIYSFSYADDNGIVNGDAYPVRAVCVHGMQFLVNQDGILTQVLTPVVDTITTYECVNGNCYPHKNSVRSAIPAACNPYPGAKKPY